MMLLHITTTRISPRPLSPPRLPPVTLRRIPIPIIFKISHQNLQKRANPPCRDDTVQTHSPLTPVRSPVRGASDSVSRHDGPHQQGGTEQTSTARLGQGKRGLNTRRIPRIKPPTKPPHKQNTPKTVTTNNRT